MAGTKKTASVDAETAEKLLDLLSSDEDFRQRFQASPLDALESIGYKKPATEALPFSACRVTQLASKEQISEAKADLKASLTQGLAYNTPTLEAETLARRTRK